ncbi:MAG: class II fructose-bisphosphate aldolase [Actinobacteria bacterium]|nr:MAG: class II fructose-bisphosphate aldolase [Actinomycetota bacterium]
MLTPFRTLLDERRAAQAAAAAFTCYDVTTALGVVLAAEERDAPLILLVSEASFRAPRSDLLVAALTAVATRSRVPACVQLDHVAEPLLVDSALAAGVGAVLVDGSHLSHEENTALVRRAVETAPRGVGVEAELGHIEGGEDVAVAAAAGAFTDPDEAADFVGETGTDCLAVSIGNVHGSYASPPSLDWERLERIRERVGDLPLALHGASGLPPEDVRRAVSLGICKVNVNTELRRRYLHQLSDRLPDALQGLRLLELEQALVAAVAEAAGETLDLLGPPSGRGSASP